MLVQTEGQFEDILAEAESKLITADTETHYTDWEQERSIVGLSIAYPVGDITKYAYFPFRHEHDTNMFPGTSNLDITLLVPLIEWLKTKTTIWHNAKFDLTQIEKEGFDPDEFDVHDTLIMSHLADENKFSHELEKLAPLVGTKKLKKSIDEIRKALGGMEKIPPDVMALYANTDVEATWKLFKLFYKQIEKDEQLEELPRQYRIMRMIRRMELRGVPLNKERALELQAKSHERQKEILEQLGYEPSKPSQLAHRLYAVPPDGLGFRPSAFSKRPSKEFASGIPIMDESVLSRLNHPEVEMVLEFRGEQKASTTYYGPWLERCNPHTGRIHPSFKQHGTVTTRWSCAGPNFQQIPRD